MTWLGKVLVFANLALSMVFAFWALGVYQGRIDWSDKPSSPDRPPGEIARRKERINRYTQGGADSRLARAEGRYQKGLRDLRQLEATRLADSRWYAEQLQALETSKEKGAVKTLVYEKTGELRLDPKTGRPELVLPTGRAEPPQPPPQLFIPSRAVLVQEYDATQKEITRERAATDKLKERERELTVQIQGEPGKLRGLRVRLTDEQEARAASYKEQEALYGWLYNHKYDAEVLLQRQKELEARLKELEGSRVAGQP